MDQRMIYLLWATVRPKNLISTWNIWKGFAAYPENLKLFVAVDDGDVKNYLEDEGIKNITVAHNPNHGVVAPICSLYKHLTNLDDSDIIILASDDFTPPKNWDSYLLSMFRSFDGLFKVNDGQMKNIISLPVLTFSAFKMLNNRIYHPAYNHMFCDQELHDVVHELGICKHACASDPEFVHHHYVHGKRVKDEFDERNSATWQKAKSIYYERRKLPLEKRLK